MVYYHNATSIRNKLNVFSRNANSSVYDIILISETNLIKCISDSEINHGNYRIYRRDRNMSESNKLSGGGVLIAVRKDLNSNIICVDTYIDQVFVEVL